MRELMGWEPLREMIPGFGGAGFAPAFDVKETKDAYVFKADLPGLKEDDVELSLTGNRLTVSGQREEERREENDRFYTFERSHGTFSRSFTLPPGIDPDHVRAELKNGVLGVVIPKKPEIQPKKIELKAGEGQKAKA